MTPTEAICFQIYKQVTMSSEDLHAPRERLTDQTIAGTKRLSH
jgi:hypothetical protein